MHASTSFHQPIGNASAPGTLNAPLQIETGRDTGGGIDTALFFFGPKPADQRLAAKLADRINATLADHKRPVCHSASWTGNTVTCRVPFEDVAALPDLPDSVVSFAALIEATGTDDWLVTDVLGGVGKDATPVRSIDIRNALFAFAELPESRESIEGAIVAKLDERRERARWDAADRAHDERVAREMESAA